MALVPEWDHTTDPSALMLPDRFLYIDPKTEDKGKRKRRRRYIKARRKIKEGLRRYTKEEMDEAFQYESKDGMPAFTKEDLVAKITAFDPYFRVPSNERSAVTRSSFTDQNNATIGSVCCFLQANTDVDAVATISAILEQIRDRGWPTFSTLRGFQDWVNRNDRNSEVPTPAPAPVVPTSPSPPTTPVDTSSAPVSASLTAFAPLNPLPPFNPTETPPEPVTATSTPSAARPSPLPPTSQMALNPPPDAAQPSPCPPTFPATVTETPVATQRSPSPPITPKTTASPHADDDRRPDSLMYGAASPTWACAICTNTNSKVSVCRICTMSWRCATIGCDSVTVSVPGRVCRACGAECPIPLVRANGRGWLELQFVDPNDPLEDPYRIQDPEPATCRVTLPDAATSARCVKKQRTNNRPQEEGGASTPDLFFAEEGIPDDWTVGKHLEETLGDKSTMKVMGVRTTEKSLRTLSNEEERNTDDEKAGQLTDEAVNLYMTLLSGAGNPGGDDVMFWSSLYYTKFMEGKTVSKGYDLIQKWVEKLERRRESGDKTLWKKIFVPVHEHDQEHWFLVTIDFDAKLILSMDSLDVSRRKERLNMLDWVKEEWESNPRWHGEFGEFDKKAWKHMKAPVPIQTNVVDCGVFTCMFAAFASNKRQMKFTQADMPRMRARMAWSILHETLG